MSEVYTHTPLEVAEGILSGKYTLTSVFVLVNQIEDLTRERDEARVERDALTKLIMDAAYDAEWCDSYRINRINPQNWRLTIYLPVPVNASDVSISSALDGAIAEIVKKDR